MVSPRGAKATTGRRGSSHIGEWKSLVMPNCWTPRRRTPSGQENPRSPIFDAASAHRAGSWGNGNAYDSAICAHAGPASHV